jgi:hypothetical protein
VAFTENELLRIARMSGITYVELYEHITFASSVYITAEVETQAREILDEYESNNVNRKTTRIKAMESNFGAEINPSELRNLLKREMASLLYLPANTSNRLERC